MNVSGPEPDGPPLPDGRDPAQRVPLLHILGIPEGGQLKDNLRYLGVLPSLSLQHRHQNILH